MWGVLTGDWNLCVNGFTSSIMRTLCGLLHLCFPSAHLGYIYIYISLNLKQFKEKGPYAKFENKFVGLPIVTNCAVPGCDCFGTLVSHYFIA